MFMENYEFDITYKVAYRAKDLVKQSISGDAVNSYNMVC